MSNKFLILQLNDKHVDESYDELLAKLAKHTPKFIEVQRALRTNGAVQRNQLIKSSEYMFQFSNIAKGIWTHCANNFYTKSLEILFGNDLPSEITEQITAFVKGYKSKEKPAEKYAYAEGKIRTLEAQTLLRILLFDINKINIEDSVVQSVDAFVQWNTALRKISNLERHHTDFEFELKDEDFELILEFLNQQDFEISLPLIAKGTLICKAIVDGVVSSIEGETLEEIYSIIEKRIDKVCEDSEASSLKVYEQRLNNLVWGPSNYQRDETFIRDAADSLEENKIVALYGMGGVGKTALAQKFMFDIINNREPYTHIVTHSSKVGSDQKEINTIGHKQRGLLVETDARLSVMDSSLVDDKGMRVIGGLRNLLLKIYKEATGESGEIFGDSKLKKEVFSELKKPENKLLIILDNFEDVEDNQDDPDVQEIRSETKSFLKDFSKQNDITSRIIITTRSSPMDVAYGIEVKHLTKSESVDLFAEKIRFRSQRTKRKDDDLTQRLIGIHQKIRSSNQLKNQLIESFDQWDTHDNHIAHPLIVLLAAEAVEHDDMIHLQDVIKEYGEGTKHSEVIEYCVSKTLGSFKQHEKYLLQVLIQNSNLNTEITTKLMHDIINNVTSNMEDNTGGNNPIHTNLLTINDSEIIDIMTRLSDRTFVRVIPKRIASGGVFWSWNKIVYDYLKSRFSAVMIEPQVKREFIPQEDLKSFPEFLTPLDDWINASTVTPLGFTQIVKPLENSVNMMHRELAKCVESGEQTYELDSLVSNLDRQSYLLIKILNKIQEHLRIDLSLKSIEASGGKSFETIVNHLLKILGRQARSWRYLSKLSYELYPPSVCVQYSLGILKSLKLYANLFHKHNFVDENSLLNLLKHMGVEHIEILETNIQLNGTLNETATFSRLDWLEQICKILKPEDTSLNLGLELDENSLEIFQLWRDIFIQTNLEERTKQFSYVEGYAFWVYIRLFATIYTSEESELRILEEFKECALLIRNITNINQYIRSVHNDQTYVLWNPDELLDAILNFRAQPSNGRLLFAPMEYDKNISRWIWDLRREGWELVVRETDKEHKSNEYQKVVLVQENFRRHEKRIVCRFYRNSNGIIVTKPGNDMTLMTQLEQSWKTSIEKIILETIDKSRNEISFRRLKLLIEQDGGPSDDDSITEIVERISNLYKADKYFVIDPGKPHSPPPPRYTEMEGGKSFFTTEFGRKDRVNLPYDPNTFAAYLGNLVEMVDKNPQSTYRQYQRRIKDVYKDNVTSGVWFIYSGLGNRHKLEWMEEQITASPNSIVELANKVKKSVIGFCDSAERSHGHSFNKDVIEAYFEDVIIYFDS